MRDAVPAHRRMHGCSECGIDDLSEVFFRRVDVIPPLVVHPLPEQLYGGLCSKFLLLWHIKVIDEDYCILAERWPVDALSLFLHVSVDDTLGLIGSGLGREGKTYISAVLVFELGCHLVEHRD